MSNAALAFLSGLAGGYYQGKQVEDEKTRRDKQDQRDQEEHDARMAALKKKLDADKAVRDAATPATVSNGATVTGVAANPTVYDNADVASSDVRQANRLAEGGAPGQQDASGAPLVASQPQGGDFAGNEAPSTTTLGAAPAAESAVAHVVAPVAASAGASFPAPAAAPASVPIAARAGMTAAPVVNGQAFPDQASAAAAAAAANSPQAIRARQIAALNAIDPERAMQMEANALTIEKAQREQARTLKQEGVFDAEEAARRGDPQGVFDAFNKNGKLKLQGVPTVTPEIRQLSDGTKIQTYTYTGTLVGPDGTTQPFQKNSYDLYKEVAPFAEVLKTEQAATKDQREAKKVDSEIKKNDAYAEYLLGAKSDAERARADAAAAKAGGKAEKLDEADKLKLTGAEQRVRDAEKAVQDSLSKLMPGDDPTKSPAVQFAQGTLRAAKLNHLRTNIELGQIPPESMVSQIMGVAKGPQDVIKSLNELASVGGAEFSDKVAALVQQNDQWKAWTAKPGAKAQAAPKPAAARGTGPAAPAAAPAAPARPAAPAGPVPQADIDAAGKELDMAREVMARLKANPPNDPAVWRDTLRAAQEQLDAAETRYQQMVASQTQPYIGRPMPRRPAAAAGLANR